MDMANTAATEAATDPVTDKRVRSRMARAICRYRWYSLMMVPGLLYFFIYHYLPMGGVIIAFKDYNLLKGVWGSSWAGLKHFETIFTSPDIYRTIGNTLIISFYRIVFNMLPDLLLALM